MKARDNSARSPGDGTEQPSTKQGEGTLATIANEDYPLSAVPPTERRGLWSLSFVLLGFTFYTGTMWAGGSLGVSYAISNLALIVAGGSILLGLYAAVVSYIAQRSGLTTVLMARFAFGEYGSKGSDLLLGLTQLGWYAWGTAMVGIVFAELVGTPNLAPLYMIVAGVVFSLTAYVGYNGLEWLAKVSVPAILALIIWSITIATRDAGGVGALGEIVPTAEMGLASALTIVFGTFAAGATQISNWTRYSRSAPAAIWAALLAMTFGNGLMIISGAYTSLVYQAFDLVEVMAIQGILFGGIVLLLLNIWTTQDNTIYNFSIAGANFARTDKRTQFVLGGAAISTVIALLGWYNQFEPFLIALGTYIPPVGGAIFGDFFLRHRRQYPNLDTNIPRFNLVGIGAYAAGVAAALRAPGIPPINGVVGAFAAYGLIHLVLRRNEQRPVQGAPVVEEARPVR